MNNRDQQDWKRYIQGEMSDKERDGIDELLLEDQEALDAYLSALAQFPVSSLPDQDSFAEQVMARIAPPDAETVPQKRTRFRIQGLLHHKMLHYTVAASITLLFLSTGVFDWLAPGHLELNAGIQQPYSEKMVEKATGWLDEMKPEPYRK
ncbi:hypothetical protein C2I18_11350 [Paenibacillus sp. PK3_47]|uniref:hypothetical protein n=1 Tax=Paenibacillus sp. PK3_47 TaxID=2072642 RepID=UPI00201DA9FC|nr:hypothetical protein [Paenibacillus sp. PK3_47]UQZ34072.1 hypothetical protein C2I18_11350 [Paenibacillus sp. PK3_47]